MKKTIIAAALILLVGTSATASAQVAVFSSPTTVRTSLNADQLKRLNSRVNADSTAGFFVFQVNAARSAFLARNPRIIVPRTGAIALTTRGVTEINETDMVWQGHVGASSRINTLRVSNGEVRGRLEIEGTEWRIFPIGDGAHAAYSRTPTISHSGSVRGDGSACRHMAPVEKRYGARLGESARETAQAFLTFDESIMTTNNEIVPKASQTSLPSVTEIDVLVVYTTDAKSDNTDIASDIDDYFDDLNQSLANNEISDQIQVNKVHSVELNYSPSPAPSTTDAFSAMANGTSPFGNLATMRSDYGADIVFLIHDEFSNLDGEAKDIGATVMADGYAVGDVDAVDSKMTLSHEIGHLLGGAHDVDTLEETDPNYNPETPTDSDPDWDWDPKAHGITRNSRTQGTIMATSTSRINWWSEDGRDFPGTSDDMGVTGESEVAEVWEDNASTLEGFVASVPEEDYPGQTLDTDLGPATIEKEWHDDINLSANALYDPSEESCDDCTYRWYEKDTSTGTPYYTGITTETYYDLVRWTSGHGFSVYVTDGVPEDEDEVWVNYCASPCSGPKRGDGYGTDTDLSIPQATLVHSSYPNPFASETTFQVETQESALVKIKVVDVSGRHIDTLVNKVLEAGAHEYTWKPNGLPNGSYVVRTVIGDFVDSQVVVYHR